MLPNFNNQLERARYLVNELDLSVIPCHSIDDAGACTCGSADCSSQGKHPAIATWKQFYGQLPTDADLETWFAVGGRNIAIVTGAVSGIVAVDFDSDEALAWAEGNLPPTSMRTKTAKGQHWFYRHPGSPVSNKAKVFPTEGQIKIDVRGDGGYVIAPGSTHPTGDVYQGHGDWTAEAKATLPIYDPGWFGVPQPRALPPMQLPPPIDPADAYKRAKAYLAEIPGAVSGEGGHNLTYKAARTLCCGFGLEERVALDLLLTEYNPRCKPPWSEKDLQHKVHDACTKPDKYGRPRGYLLSNATTLDAVLGQIVHAGPQTEAENMQSILHNIGTLKAEAKNIALVELSAATETPIEDLAKALAKDQPGENKDRLGASTELYRMARPKIEELVNHRGFEQYAIAQLDGKRAPVRIQDAPFEGWLRLLYHTETKKVCPSEAPGAVQAQLCAEARAHGSQRELCLRVGEHEGAFLYDLADDKSRAVKITPGNWEIVDQPPLIFRRYAHMCAQVEPAPKGDIDELLALVNVHTPADRLLLKTWVVVALVPGIPHAVLAVTGSKGTGKSTLFRMIRDLIDPSALSTLTLKKKDLALTLDHNYCVPLDNLSGLSQALSDTLCKAVTGDATVDRLLYTNAGEHISKARCVIAINGINPVVRASDLIDRCLTISLAAVPDSARLEESDLNRQFAAKRPTILAGMFDLLAKARELYSGVDLPLGRMADFTRWGEAIAQAMGEEPGRFAEVYAKRRIHQIADALVSEPVAEALLIFMNKRTSWKGSHGALRSELTTIAGGNEIDTKQRSWPKSDSSLSQHLGKLQTDLPTVCGIAYERYRDRNNLSKLHLRKVENKASAASGAPDHAGRKDSGRTHHQGALVTSGNASGDQANHHGPSGGTEPPEASKPRSGESPDPKSPRRVRRSL